jgi:hypothetical protein
MNLLKNFNRKSSNIMNENVKFCKDCKYFLPNTFLIPNYEFGKCALHNKIKKNDENYLVTGKIKKEQIEYTYCSIARNNENMCGQEGKDFISKFNKKKL